ncbi:hypothetical protein L208DRAFT_1399230 [Tricholoma matsutake]|nr:hypothetical protein L208DRAFT_1399230 [Tricholoma matsutake 945]
MRLDQEQVSQYEDRYQAGMHSDQVWQTRPHPSLCMHLGQTPIFASHCTRVLSHPPPPLLRKAYMLLRIYPPTLLSCLSASRIMMMASRDWSYSYNGGGG